MLVICIAGCIVVAECGILYMLVIRKEAGISPLIYPHFSWMRHVLCCYVSKSKGWGEMLERRGETHLLVKFVCTVVIWKPRGRETNRSPLALSEDPEM